MSSFEFAFSLFGLVLGLSVAEVMAGFARVLRARHKIQLGLATPLLGLLLLVDLVTFWSNGWDMRDAIPPSFEALLYGTVIAAVYFLAAALVFPVEIDEWPDLDSYFMLHKGQVMAGVVVANLLVLIARVLLYGAVMVNWRALAIPLVCTGLGLILMRSDDKGLCIAMLWILLAMYAASRLF